jgi:hypothetical protein
MKRRNRRWQQIAALAAAYVLAFSVIFGSLAAPGSDLSAALCHDADASSNAAIPPALPSPNGGCEHCVLCQPAPAGALPLAAHVRAVTFELRPSPFAQITPASPRARRITGPPGARGPPVNG